LEIPEIANGLVEIKNVAREAGSRSKVAIWTEADNVDPVGSCVGQRGSRIQTIISELGGEKIDIIEFSEDQEKFIANALAPAKIMGLDLNEAEHKATVRVSPDKLSLAIGKNGQNVRLAARLTGWKIDIIEATPEGEKKVIGNDEEIAVGEGPAETEIMENDETVKAADESTEVKPEVNKVKKEKKAPKEPKVKVVKEPKIKKIK